MSKIVFNQVEHVPTSTGTGATQIYTKTDGLLYAKDAAHPEMQVTVLSGGVVTIAGALSASGSLSATNVHATDVYGNAQTMTNAGIVLQVVNYPFNGTGTSAATSYTETGLSAVITPVATSSKVLVEFHLFLSHNGDGQGAFTRLSRAITGGSTSYPVLNTAGSEGQAYAFSVASNGAEYNITGETISMSYLDSPSTTSAVEYNVAIKNAAATTKWNSTADSNYSTRNQISFITLTEIAG